MKMGIQASFRREYRFAVAGFAAAFVLVGGATTALTLGGRRAFLRPAVRQPRIEAEARVIAPTAHR